MRLSGLGLSGAGAVAAPRHRALANQEETRLVEAARVDPTAFDGLYQLYLTPVYRYLCLHTANQEDAADMTQQVFLQALRGLAGYRERQLPFAAWLFRIAHNLAIDSYRRHHVMLAWERLPEHLHPPGGADPEATVLDNERQILLRQLFDRLDPASRELLALRFAAGFTAREIAVVVGKREEAVQKQLNRLLKRLRDQYKEQGL